MLFRSNSTYPGGIDGFRQSIAEESPTYIVVQTGFHPNWLMPWLRKHYARLGPGPQIEWWVSKKVPPAEREQIMQARQHEKKG